MFPETLSKPYNNQDEAAVAGFNRVLLNGQEWESKEFAFWVVLKVDQQKKVKFHYTMPHTDGSAHGVKLKLPVGHIVRAFCHTHPKSLSSGAFSPDDLDQFKELSRLRPGIAWYLMDPNKQLRLAVTEKDFMWGKSVGWLRVEP